MIYIPQTIIVVSFCKNVFHTSWVKIVLCFENLYHKQLQIALVCGYRTIYVIYKIISTIFAHNSQCSFPNFVHLRNCVHHVGDTLEEKNRIERMSFMKEVLVCPGLERGPPPVVGKGSSTCRSTDESAMNMRSSLFRREFHIMGSIGEPGHVEKLNFASLANQIDSSLRKGYDEDDIVDGVLLAITPGSHLRSFLEASSDLTLGFVENTQKPL